MQRIAASLCNIMYERILLTSRLYASSIKKAQFEEIFPQELKQSDIF
ncbi:hypothetical protein M4L90_07430 [Staphylococcus equorum]|uniref:Uncharacterized protein n=1 Tax=Staphylococcus equorum TaxID=246432 RepID=A0A9X4QY54_9STAP|nr:hypothetical protein [Staphylococcus equorum]ALM55826.1 hypothetical protein SE1039_00430 [Staphylococcus equorum]MDG0819732.1 hypothetical protein [Staphylococcus equorum]MDG0840373.1 hypothetical protein [Staphylococcus equorum]MDG0846056.1 hypothetical protein [Staphylococcus equorum]